MAKRPKQQSHTPAPPETPQEGVPPLTKETLGGALIDSARISVVAALAVLPRPPEFARIVLPGDDADGLVNGVHDCLEEALHWLDAARALSVEQNPDPPTSLHVVTAAEAATAAAAVNVEAW